MKLIFSDQDGALREWLDEVEQQISEAAAGAVQETAELAVAEGRSNIASAGFSPRWQAGLKSKFFPDPEPTALVFHTIPFAGVFEFGARISGDPLLWLPIESNLPAGIRSPRKYGRKLVSVNVAGKPPLLFDAADRERGPLFFGTPVVNIQKHFNLYRIFAQAIEHMAEFYEKRIKG